MRCRIAVIEDNPPDVLLIEEALRSHGIDCELVHFRDGQEAYSGILGNVGEARFSLFILDLNMPRVGGLEVLERLRSETTFQDVPVLVLTSSLSVAERKEASRLGATLFVRKPADLYEFLDQVGSAAAQMLNIASAPLHADDSSEMSASGTSG
ncbi:MAG TPA: response regulator [Bryobacteraceae bacterium]|jgi:CheY-like chemotaxis protein|nr:response regulator [Bryobacteraceae bacterium]